MHEGGAWLLAITLSAAGAGAAKELVLPLEGGPNGPGGHAILVRASVFDRNVLLIVDTGSAQTILRPDLVRMADAALVSPRFETDGPGFRANGTFSVATIRLGARTWPFRRVVAMRFDELARAWGAPIDGILGQDLLREFRSVTIDYASKTLRLSP